MRSLVGCAAGLGVTAAVLLRLPFLGDLTVSIVSDLGQLGAAVAATVGAAVAAGRSTGHRARSWRWIAVGTGCWAAGQAVWSWYELVLGRDVPFPSLADVGFLLFPVGMAIGLLSWLGSQSDQLAARGRDLLDGAIIAASLLVLSWVTTLGTVVHAGGASWLPLGLSLAYPVGDLVVATLVLMALARGGRSERVVLVVLALGLGGLAASDSAYVYLVGVGAYSSADVASSGWILGFLLVGAAGLGAASPAGGVAPNAVTGAPLGQDRSIDASWLRLALPYVPLTAAGAVLVVTLLHSATTSTVGVLLGVVLVVLVLARQFLGLLDNHRLLATLGTTRDQLQHQATHDALTGLPNRTLFADRLRAALARPESAVGVLYCDLDDFKLVNDRHGHHVGDELLVVVAQRLLQCVRTGDTVARLGGDEFALVVDSDQAEVVADRVVQLLGRPVEVHGRVLSASVSIGVAHHSADHARPPVDAPVGEAPTDRRRRRRVTTVVPAGPDPEALATLMLRQADHAMYAAKQAGKGRAVLADLAPLSA